MAVFRVRDYEDKSIDFQASLRIGAWAIAGLYIACYAAAAREVVRFKTTLPWIVFLVFSVVNIPSTDNWLFGLISATTFLMFYLYVGVMILVHGRTLILNALIISLAIIALISLIVYFAYPALGRMPIWIGNIRVPSNRMSGILGSANGVGVACGLALTLLVIYWREITALSEPLKCALFVLFAIDLVMSINRMSILAAAGCIALYMIIVRRSEFTLMFFWLLAMALIALFILLGEDALLLFSRSGSVNELTTATGRAEIWETVIALWTERPLLGWGHASAIAILPYMHHLFLQAAHAHNLFLEVLFSRGLVGFSVFILGFLWCFTAAFRYGRVRPMILMLFFLAVGMMEPIPLGNRAGSSFLIFSFAIFEMAGLRVHLTAQRSRARLAVPIRRAPSPVGTHRAVESRPGAGAPPLA